MNQIDIEMREIPGFEGEYAATADGHIYSYKTKKILHQYDNKRGYQLISLYKDGKKRTKRVHILVAKAFDLPKPDVPAGTKLDVAHKDDNPSNNAIENLEWQTRKQNLDTDSFRERSKKRNRTKIRCVETGEIFKNQSEAARAIGKHKYGINLCVNGKQETCGGYHWVRVIEDKEN